MLYVTTGNLVVVSELYHYHMVWEESKYRYVSYFGSIIYIESHLTLNKFQASLRWSWNSSLKVAQLLGYIHPHCWKVVECQAN